MATDLVNKANSLYVDEDYEEAVTLYSKALDLEPQNAGFYASRAQAHLQMENFMDAAEDAGKAIEISPKMAKAYLRKGIACFYLDEFETAKTYFSRGAELDPSKLAFKTWTRKCDAELADEMEEIEEDDEVVEDVEEIGKENGTVGTSEPPPPQATNPSIPTESRNAVPVTPATSSDAPCKENPAQPITPAAPPAAVRKYRHQWYQTQANVQVDIFAKKMMKERVKVDISESALSVVILSENGEEEYELTTPLFANIVPQESKFEILSTKIEVKLKKVDLGRNWSSLEKSGSQPLAEEDDVNRRYPSSYKKKVIDWNKLEEEVKTEEDNEKLEGDAAVQKLFKQIYANADEDTRRAMNKSFQESNGTVLSTNWSEVGTKKVECTPPSGMETKEYDE